MNINLNYEQTDEVIIRTLMAHIIDQYHKEDRWETPDNSVKLLSNLYGTLEYFMEPETYKKFVVNMRDFEGFKGADKNDL